MNTSQPPKISLTVNDTFYEFMPDYELDSIAVSITPLTPHETEPTIHQIPGWVIKALVEVI